MSSTLPSGHAPAASLESGLEAQQRSGRLHGFARAVVRGFWFGIVPAGLAWGAAAVLTPNALQARRSPLLAYVLQASEAMPFLPGVLLFLLFSWQARVWRAHLPGAAWAELPRRSGSAGASWRFGLLAAAAIVLTLAARTSVFEPYRVVSASMLPTLSPSDWIGVDKRAYGTRLPWMRYRFGARLPRRGDVIAFETPKELLGQPTRLVKRVVGLPGDRIAISRGQLEINGWPVPQCDAGVYAFISDGESVQGRLVVEFLDQQPYLTVYFGGGAPFAEYTVRRGEVFVLGDNRNNSSDSRSFNAGAGGGLPLKAIEGRVAQVLWSKAGAARGWQSGALQPLWRELQQQGLDLRELRAGIDRCLREAPENTTPPRASR